MSLLFNMLSRLVITLLPRSKCLNFMAEVTICSDFGAPKIKSVTVYPSICHELVVLEKTLESPLDCKEIQPAHPKGDQSWVLIGRTEVEAETAILWPPDAKSWLIGKDPDAGKDWGQEEKGTTEDEMAGWHHQLDGREFEWTPGVGDGQGGLACCGSWGCRESDTTEWLNWSGLSSGNQGLVSGLTWGGSPGWEVTSVYARPEALGSGLVGEGGSGGHSGHDSG